MSKSLKRVRAALEAAGQTPEIREVGQARTAQEAADSVGCEIDQIAKSIIFLGEESGRAVLFLTAGGWIIDVMTTAPLVREQARAFLPYMVAAPIFGCAAWMLDGIFIGATRTGDMRNMMGISFAVYVVAALVLVPSFGNHGLWLAFLLSFIARGVTLGLKYPGLERSVA